jgi:hypothetical protein
LSATSLVLGAVAFLVAQGALRNAMMLGAVLARACAGIVMAGEWAKQDRISIASLLFRYEMLKQLEDKAGVLFPIFHREENFYKEGNGRITHCGFSQSAARWLPRMFGFSVPHGGFGSCGHLDLRRYHRPMGGLGPDMAALNYAPVGPCLTCRFS